MNLKLVSFFYILLRDKLPAGEVEAIMMNHVEKCEGKTVKYSNQYIEAYARELTKRLEVHESDV